MQIKTLHAIKIIFNYHHSKGCHLQLFIKGHFILERTMKLFKCLSIIYLYKLTIANLAMVEYVTAISFEKILTAFKLFLKYM